MNAAIPWNKKTMFFLTQTLVLVVSADWLFYRQPAGWNTGLWALILIGVVVLTHRRAIRTRAGKLILFALLGISAALMAQPGPIVVSMAGLGAVSLALIGRSGWAPRTEEWFRRWVFFGLTGWLQVLEDLLIYQRWRHKGHGSPLFARALRGLRNWMVPLLFTLAFLILFAIANPVISKTLENLNTLLSFLMEQMHLDAIRVCYWVFIGTGSWALLRKRVLRRPGPAPAVQRAQRPGLPDLVARCLILFNALFAVQNLLDLRYLYGGAALPSGMTYAEYAHRGAYPLIATALLAAAFVLITFRPGGLTEQRQTARRLVFLWLGQNVFLTLSALWMLHLYVQVYSLTRLRVAAAIWMLLVAAGLAWTGLRILTNRSNQWLTNINFVTTLFVLFLCCFVNFHGMIAWYNVKHCREVTGDGVNIDLRYLSSLGPEAIPAFEWLSQQVGPVPVGASAALQAEIMRSALHRQMRNWRGWTLRYHVLNKGL